MLPDTGGTDGGSGRTDGGGGGTDSGTAGRDSGMSGGMCAARIAADDIPPLGAACLPRCMRSTLDRINMCSDNMCVDRALMNDTTPGIPWTINGMPAMQPLNCQTCVIFQQISCAHDVCPTETIALLACNPMMDADMCNGEGMALDRCLMDNQETFMTCAQREVTRCFATSSGFLPDFEARPIPTLPWSSIDHGFREMYARSRGL
jgi:hypothetical protein